jgi:IS605 OrfB family transposase
MEKINGKVNGKDKWKFKGIQLIFDKLKQQFYASLIFTADKPSVFTDGAVLGIDRGLINTISCSNGLEISGKHRNEIKRRNSYNRKKLQAKGTRSSKKRLRVLSGREKRFSQNENHIISKSLVQLPFQYFIFEDLSKIRNKSRGKIMNRKVSNWCFYQLEMYTKYKAEAIGKVVDYVNPQYTSQRCNSCGHIDRKNRNRGEFCCIKCGHTDGADQNASKNIRDLWINEKISKEQAPVNEPNNSQTIDISSLKEYPTIKAPPRLNSMVTKGLLTSNQVGTSPFQASLGGGS